MTRDDRVSTAAPYEKYLGIWYIWVPPPLRRSSYGVFTEKLTARPDELRIQGRELKERVKRQTERRPGSNTVTSGSNTCNASRPRWMLF